MGLVTVMVGAYVIHKVYKNAKAHENGERIEKWVHRQLALPSHKRDARHDAFYRDATLQQVMAMLVDGVYSRDRAAVDFHLIMKPFVEGFYDADERTEHYTHLHWTRMSERGEAEEKKVGLRHYLRCDPHPNALAPRLVIALRGTKLSSGRDIVDDIKIGGHRLHYSRRFEACERLVESIIRTFLERYDGKPSEVFITGHSLGAAIAFLIARKLAVGKKEERYTVHCFNPPFLTALMVIEKCFFFAKARELIHSAARNSEELLAETSKRFMVQMLVDPSTVEQEVRHFASLVDWVPVLYVNKHDVICREYLRYYKRKEKKFSQAVVISTQALVTSLLGRKVKYSSLVPSVQILVNKRQKRPHDLKQWYQEADLVSGLMVKVKQFRLIREALSPNTLHLKVDAQQTIVSVSNPKVEIPHSNPEVEIPHSNPEVESSDSEDESASHGPPLLGCANLSHNLTLLGSSPYGNGRYWCDFCRKVGEGPVYHCASCKDFDLHPDCATIATEIVSFTHPEHRLFLQRPYSCGSGAVCDGCLGLLGGCQWVYTCGTPGCDFDLHARCAKYKRTIVHSVHKEHKLVLVLLAKSAVDRSYVSCDDCGRRLSPGQLVYRCKDCDFDVHPTCILRCVD